MTAGSRRPFGAENRHKKASWGWRRRQPQECPAKNVVRPEGALSRYASCFRRQSGAT